MLRRLLGREHLEKGDDIFGNKFEHFFYRDQITSELDAAGFKLESVGFFSYGHAVGSAR